MRSTLLISSLTGAEGYMVGSLIIMSCITLANMRKGVLLHKLILLELVMGYWQVRDLNPFLDGHTLT